MGQPGYELSLSDDTDPSRFAFLNSGFPQEAVMEYHDSRQLRFQRWLSGSWASTLMTLDLVTDNIGINTNTPDEKLHVNGTLGIGKFNDQNNAGLKIEYVDGGSGTTTFRHNRYGGTNRFARGSSSGERLQVDFGGSNNHFLNIYDGNNTSRIRFQVNGTSYITQGPLILGATSTFHPGTARPNTDLEVHGDLEMKNGSKIFFGAENDEDGYFRLFNLDKFNGLDYSQNFYIRRATINNNDGAVMGFQKDGTVTIGIWERYDGTVVGDGAYKLMVNGAIRCEKLKVETDVPNSDHVFEKDYNLMPLEEVHAFVTENKHLPEIPSAAEFQENGYLVGEMDDLLLRKVEELTLYIIAQQKQIDELLKAQQQ